MIKKPIKEQPTQAATPFVVSKGMLFDCEESIIDRVCILYGVDLKASSGRLTKNKKIEAVLEKQNEALTKGETPKGLKEIFSSEGISTVMADISLTINMGNYESLKIGGGITVPVGTDEAGIKAGLETFKKAVKEVTEVLKEEIPVAKKEFKPFYKN